MLVLTMLIDNKASWLGIALSSFYLLHRLGKSIANARHWMKYIFVFISLFGLAFWVVLKSSGTLHKYTAIKQAWDTGNFLNLGKFKAYRDVIMAYDENPHMALVGSGPGTFYSRASSQFYELSDDMFILPFAGLAAKDEVYQASDAMKGVIEKAGIAPFFKTFFMNSRIFLVGSGTTDDPFFSFVALLGETGILGTLIYLGMYVAVFKKLSFHFTRFQKDPLVFPLISCALGFLVYLMVISKYNNWLETGRLTTTIWSMIAMVFKYVELCDMPAEAHR
jgi:hypothetical protein